MDGDSFDDPCGPTPIGKLGLRIGAIFIIMVTSMFGTLFPILSKRNSTLRRIVPGCEWGSRSSWGGWLPGAGADGPAGVGCSRV